MIDRSMPWLVFPPAVDLANTVVLTGTGPVDLLTTDDELAAWVDAESARFPEARSALGRLAETRELRNAVHEVLHASARSQVPPETAVAAVNDASAASPLVRTLDGDLEVRHRELGRSGWDRFRGAVGRSAVDLAAGGTLAECGAPSCGMLFVPASRRQAWCSAACGNRARVARHLRRRRELRRAPPTTPGDGPAGG